MKQINKDFLASAKRNGNICKQGKDIIKRAETPDELVESFRKNIVWLMKNNYPNESELMQYFNGFVSEWLAVNALNAEFKDNSIVCLLCGSRATATYSNNSRGRLFVRHNSKLTLKVEKGGYCILSLYENAQVKIEAAEGAEVFVFLFDNATVVETQESKDIIIIKQ